MIYSILGIIHLILFVIAAFEIITSSKDIVGKLFWLFIILVLPLIGLILYYLIGRGR